jgi:hypothetical protein
MTQGEVVRRIRLLGVAGAVLAALLPTAAQAVKATPRLTGVITTRPVAAGFAKVALTGPAGQTVRLRVGNIVSAPVHLDGTRQMAGIRVPEAGRLEILADHAGLANQVTAEVAVTAAEPTTSTVTPGTRVVNVNGDPFVGKGFLYWPAKVGEEWPANTWADPETCQNDARLMGAAGVTLLRVPFEDHEPAVKEQYQQCLDAFHANGIYVLWLFGPPSQFETFHNYEPIVQAYADKLATGVRDVGDHPATAFWTVGNEIERSNDAKMWLGDKQHEPNSVGVVDRLISGMKALDGGRHLAGTTICCPEIIGALWQANVPNLDFWGLNAYHQPYYQAATWFDQLNNVDPRPKVITETGTDRYFCFKGLGQVATIQATCKTSYKNPAQHSGENQTQQRDWDLKIWDNIAPRISTPANTGGAVFGVTFFMWSDLWWFSLGFLVPSSTAIHEVIGVTPWSAPDNVINIEWHGVANAQPAGATEPRVTSLAFDGLAQRWAATAPPTMSNVAVSATGTAVTVTWTTSEPATSEVQAGASLEENRDGGDMRSDSTLLRRVAYDDTLTTSHSVTFDAVTVDPGVCEKVVPRSFTADGRSATGATYITGCPSTMRFGGV